MLMVKRSVVCVKIKTKKILYRELIFDWLNYKQNYVKESTFANYSNIVYNHLIPSFGDVYLRNINHNLLQQYIFDKFKSGKVYEEGGLSEKSIKDIMMVLKNSLKYAMNQGIMDQINLDFKYPKNNKKQKVYILSKREQKKITEYILNDLTPKNLGILISLYSGMRIGEICALKWSDIDFKNNIIHVNKTLQRIYLKENSNSTVSKIIISSPKTINSNRDIPISRDFADIIKPLKINSKFYVLTSSLECIEPRAYRKHFASMLKKINIKPINFHSLRHTFATNCISLGIDYKTVSDLLGHSDINITLNLYVHPNLSQKKKCMNIIWKNHS